MPSREIDTLVAQPSLYFELGHMEGAIGRFGPDYSAVGHRDAAFLHVICTRWSEPEDREGQVAWARSFWSELLPFTAGGGYVNYLGEEGDERILGSYGSELYERLERLKAAYDPTNFFASNQNIRPRGAAQA
jgi:FAD/FMN-containing dehydrogenase